MTQIPKRKGSSSIGAMADLLKDADRAVQKSDLMLELIKDELGAAKMAHGKVSHATAEILSYYQSIRDHMPPEEKQEFFLAMLNHFDQLSEARRETLRAIVRRHILRIRQSEEESGNV